MRKRNVLESPRLSELKTKRRKVVKRKIFFLLFGILVTTVFLSYLSRAQGLNINDVQISGNKVLESEEIKRVIEKELTGSYFLIFPKTNVLFYPENKILDALYGQFQRLDSITLDVKNRKTLGVLITERAGMYLWCGDTPPPEIDNKEEQCYFLDENGYVFDTAPYFSGDVYFKFYGNLPKDNQTQFGTYMEETDFKKLILFKEAFINMGLKPVLLYKENDKNLKIFLSKTSASSSNPEILFNKYSNLEILAENLKVALSTEPLQSEFKNKYFSLLYIDLRFENKVYYKFK